MTIQRGVFSWVRVFSDSILDAATASENNSPILGVLTHKMCLLQRVDSWTPVHTGIRDKIQSLCTMVRPLEGGGIANGLGLLAMAFDVQFMSPKLLKWKDEPHLFLYPAATKSIIVTPKMNS